MFAESTRSRSASHPRSLWSPPAVTPYTSPLDHLSDHIGRIADLVAAHLARAPQQVNRNVRAIDRGELLARAALRGRADVPSEATSLWALADEKLAWIREREALTLAEGRDLPLLHLARSFGLSRLEQDALLLAAAPVVDARYQEDWSAIDSDMTRPTVRVAIAVLGRTFEAGIAMRAIFSHAAPLVLSSLLLVEGHRGGSESDFLDLGLEVPRRIVNELLGDAALDEELMGFSRLRTATVPLDQVVLPRETKDLVLSLVENHEKYLSRRREWGVDDVVTYGKGLVLLFSGLPGTGKTMLANAVAHKVGRRLFTVDAAKLWEGQRTIESNLDAVFREAKLLDAVLFFDECEQIFASRRGGNAVMPMLLTRIEAFDGIAILATNMAETLDEALARRIVAVVRFEPPTPSGRREIWRKHLPEAMPLADDVDLDRLASDYELTGGLIKNAVLASVVRSVAKGAASVTMEDLEHGARLQVRVDVGTELSVVRPEARLQDVVLPTALRARIDAFVAAARVRSTVLAEWGFGRTLGRGTGLAALFSGPPGTGKSLAAEAVATALERPLLRCPIPSVISRYVGETSRNLEKLFQTAREQRAVLVFDEADALFAKRVETRSANDRFVNAETGALLTQLERHEGVVILTTNLLSVIDAAFDRRLNLKVAFPAPDARARAAIWRALVPADAPVAADVDFVRLGKQFEMNGGSIRNAVLAAALEAATMAVGERRISQAMLEQAAREQLDDASAPSSGCTTGLS